jgi:hypothetical protein
MVKLKQTGLRQLLSASMVGAVALIASISSVQAVLLPPSPTVTATTNLVGTAAENPGVIPVGGNIVTAFANPSYSGTIESIVVRRNAASITNGATLIAGGLDFYYQIRLNPTPASADIRAFTLSPYDPFIADAFFDTTVGAYGAGSPLFGEVNGTQNPVLVSRDAAGIKFDFRDFPAVDNSLVPATPLSTWVVLRTNATVFGTGNAALIDGRGDNAAILAPIPEPTTLLFGLGLVGAAGISRIRKVRNSDALVS